MDTQPAFTELLTPAQMGEADRRTIAAGTTGIALMECAGAAVAEEVARLLPSDSNRVVALCGPGNNGGDGFVAGRILRERGFQVTTALLGDADTLKGDAAAAFRLWDGPLADIASISFDRADLVIDALFGAGLARDLDGQARALVEQMNAWASRTGRPIVAVDVPSGVDGATGSLRGAAPRAASTVTFFRLKPGHLMLPGRALCGRIVLADIGIPSDVLDEIAPQTFANIPALWRRHFPTPRIDGHKFSRGHTLVLTGGATTTGAGRLSARGAIRAGAGLVTVASPREALAINAAHLTAIMLTPCDTPLDLRNILADQRKNAVVLGPGFGLGEHTRAMAAVAMERNGLRTSRSLVLDADALTSFAGDVEGLRDLIAAAPGPVVLTPHEGEFARLFNSDGSLRAGATGDVAVLPRLDRARAAAHAIGATIILKGPDTIVAHPDGRASIASNAPPWLATAGAGDVLAGFTAALLAQGMPAFDAASAAVWLHGEAARAFGPGLIAEDLPETLPLVLRQLVPEGCD